MILALSMVRRSVSPLAAALALCLSGSPLARFLRLHFRVVRIFHTRLLRVLVRGEVAGRIFLDGDEGLRDVDEAVDFKADGGDELFPVRR